AIPPELDQPRRDAERSMEVLVCSAALAGIPHQPLLEKGATGIVFPEMIEKHQIDLVVIATHGRSGLTKLVLGSVAEEIFRSVTCPVLTIGPGVQHKQIAEGVLGHVLFATDLSSTAIHALPYAVALAVDYRARLTLVHVVEEVATIPLYYRERALRDAREEMDAMAATIPALGGEPDTMVLARTPAETILELASD